MPRKDRIHQAVRNALVKDGWTVTDDPFRIAYEEQFTRPAFAIIIREKNLPLLVVDIEHEEVAR
jgi:hypothetical protein